MNHKQRQRLFFALCTLTLVCILVAASHRLLGDIISMQLMCCHALIALLPGMVAMVLVMAVRVVLWSALLVGVGRLGQRLWHTRRFVGKLQAAANAQALVAPPARVAALAADLGLTHPIAVLATPAPLALCFGLLHPAICVSTGLIDRLTERELKAVLLHEEYHRRHYDPLRTLLADAIAGLLFFLPAAAEWRNLFHIATELEADRYAVRLAGRFALASALHKLLTHPLATHLPATNRATARSFSPTDARLAHLLDGTSFAWCFSPHSLLHSSLILILICVVLQIAL